MTYKLFFEQFLVDRLVEGLKPTICVSISMSVINVSSHGIPSSKLELSFDIHSAG